MVTEASCPNTGTGSTKTVSTEQQGTAIRFYLCTQVSSGYLPHSIVEGASRFRLDPWRTKTNPRHSNISENADSQHETTNNQIPKHNSPHSFNNSSPRSCCNKLFFSNVITCIACTGKEGREENQGFHFCLSASSERRKKEGCMHDKR